MQKEGVVHPIASQQEYDAIDRKLLSALSVNVRFTPSFLGKLVHLSKDGIRYRIKKFFESHTILGTAVIVNPFAIGFNFYTATFELKDISAEQEQSIMIQLAMHPNTIWVGRCLGEWNLIVFYIAHEKKENDVFQSISSSLSEYVNKQELAKITALHHYHNLPTWFLEENGMNAITIVRKDSSFQKLMQRPSVSNGIVSIDELDLSILCAFGKSCTQSIADISRQLKKPFNTIKTRIQSLIRERVILAFNPLINLALLRQNAFSVFIYVDNGEQLDEIRAFLKAHSNTGYLFETEKPWQFEWYAAVRNNAEFYQSVEELRSKFPAIKNIVPLFIIKDYKFTFTPEIICKKN